MIKDPSLRPVDIVALVKQTEAVARQKAAPEVRLNCVLGASELTVPSDPTLIGHVFNSFIDNACKYTQHGSITFGFDVNGNELYFFVKDTGVGLTAQQVDDVFDGPTQDLPQAKSIIEGMGGEIGAESRGPGKGSTFWFTLPLDEAAEKALPSAATTQTQGGWPQQPGWGQPQAPQQPVQPGAWGQQPAQQPAWPQQSYPQQPAQQPGWNPQYQAPQPGWPQQPAWTPQQPQQPAWGQPQYPQQPQQPSWGQPVQPQQPAWTPQQPQPMQPQQPQQPQQPMQPQQPAQSFTPPQPQERLTILIAEDNESNYILFESILEGKFNLVHALNGQEAVEMTRQYNPSLILMDINMPVMDGYEAVKNIRMFNSQVPIIAVTAYAFVTDKQRIYDNGFNGYVSKPINIQRLQRLISTHLGINM